MQDKDRLDNKRGLDKELQEKLASKLDVGKCNDCLEWIAAVTGKKTTGDFHEDLKDGYLLCLLLKRISLQTYKDLKIKAKHTKQPFVARTQIQNFVAGCKKLGMTEQDVCSSQDLYEGDNLNNVVNHLNALNAICYKLEAAGKFKGPFLPHAHTKFATENKRHFTKEQLDKAKGIVPLQNRGGISHESKSDHDSYGIVKTSAVSGAKGVVPMLSSGGPKQDAAANFDSYGIVKSTDKASSAVPKLAQGGPKQDATANFDSYGIVKSQEKASSAVPKLAQGGPKVDASSNFDSYGIVKKADDDEMKTIAKGDV